MARMEAAAQFREMSDMKVMGIDPGTIKLGIGIVEGDVGSFRSCAFTTLYLNKKRNIPERLLDIFNEIGDIISEKRPDVIAIEDVFFGRNFKSAVKIGEARASVIVAAAKRGVEVAEYPPARIKSAVCGNGRASKVQVQEMVRTILSLPEKPQSDAADALAVAICHFHNLKFRY